MGYRTISLNYKCMKEQTHPLGKPSQLAAPEFVSGPRLDERLSPTSLIDLNLARTQNWNDGCNLHPVEHHVTAISAGPAGLTCHLPPLLTY